MRRLVLGVFLLGSFTACTGQPAPPSEMTDQARGQIQAEVLEWSDQWLAQVTSLDPQGAAGLFDQADAHFMNGASYQGNWQQFLDETRSLYEGWEVWDGSWVTRRVDVLAPDAALLVGEVAGLQQWTDGSEYDFNTYFSFVLRKKGEAWTGLFGHVTGSRTPRD